MKFYYFSGVKFTAGIVNGLIFNINNGRYKSFDIELLSCFNNLHGITVSLNNNTKIQELINVLVLEEWGFISPSTIQIIEPEERFERPNLIDNCIIDFNPKNSCFDLIDVLKKVNKLRCKAIVIRMYFEIKFNYLVELKNKLVEFNFEYIELILKLSDPSEIQLLDNLGFRIHIYNWIHPKLDQYSERITTSSSNLEPHLNCGFVNQFSVNITHYMESKFYNSCLNSKLGIDVLGNIKNCPSDPTIFGNVKYDDLGKIVRTKEFQKKWHIKKDEIKTCKACEYRYICTDCRVYTKNDELLEKPKHCNYDPFTGTWNI